MQWRDIVQSLKSLTWRRAGALVLNALRLLALACPPLLFYGIWYADEHREPLRTTPMFLAVVAFALLLGRRSSRPAPVGAPRGGLWARGADRWGLRFMVVVALGFLWILMSRHPYQGMIVYNLQTTGLRVAVAFAIAGLAFILVRPPTPWVTLGILIAGALAIRSFGLRECPIRPEMGDMLPLIRDAIDNLLSGRDPYGVHTMQIGSQVPLTYPPGMWLAFLPARLLGVDIRWTSWVADAVIAVALAWPALRAAAASRAPREGLELTVPPPTWPVLLAVAAYLFLPDTHWNGIYAEPQVDWVAVALLACAIASGRPIATGLVLGAALAMRPLNLPLAPLVCVGLWKIFGLRRAAQAALAGAAVTLALYLPFVLWNPNAFFLGTVRWLFRYSWYVRDWFYGMMGFTGPLTEASHAGWLHPVQLAAIATGLGVIAWRVRTPRGLLAVCAAVYCVVVAFNPLIWMSFWIGAVILVAATVGCPDFAPPPRAPVPCALPGASWPLRLRALVADARFLVAGFVVVAALGTWMGVLLARHFSEDGRTEVRQALLSRLRAGDLVVDRTGWRFSIIETPYILELPELPAGVALAEDAYSSVMPEYRAIQPGTATRVLAVDRYDLFDIDRPAYLGIYRTVSEERFGRFGLTTLERAVAGNGTRLSDVLPGAVVAMDTSAGRATAEWKGWPPRWTFAGMPDWQDVKRQVCRHRGLDSLGVWAHPRNEGPLVLGMPVGPEARYVLVSAGLLDEAPEWDRAPVYVDVWNGGSRALERIRFPNEPGRFGRVVPLPPGHGDMLELSIAAVDVGRRHFCLDATVW